MKKQRNPEATCETCPYALSIKHNDKIEVHACQRFSKQAFYEGSPTNISQVQFRGWRYPEMTNDMRCGEHPDFFLEQEEAKA